MRPSPPDPLGRAGPPRQPEPLRPPTGQDVAAAEVRAGATPRDLTPGKNLKASFAGWAADLRHFYVQTNERDPKFFDCYRYHADGFEVGRAEAGVEVHRTPGVRK